MHISRIQVEGGFLNGLDLRLPPGLVTIIGARGTGKTSIIELMRYALGVKNHTKESASASLEHTNAVLPDGEVTVTLEKDLSVIYASRSSIESKPRVSESITPIIIFSQKEVESIGLTQLGRLNLIDSFSQSIEQYAVREASSANEIKILSKRISAQIREIDAIADETRELEALRAHADALRESSAANSSKSSEIKESQERLAALTDHIVNLKLTEEYAEQFGDSSKEWIHVLRETSIANPMFEDWEGSLSPNPTTSLKDLYGRALAEITGAIDAFTKIQKQSAEIKNSTQSRRLDAEMEARSIRSNIEKILEGAGQLSRQLSSVRSRVAQLEFSENNIRQMRSSLAELVKRRDELLDQLEKIRASRSSERSNIIDLLNHNLRPKIEIKLERFGQYNEYIEALTSALRGSGLKYKDLASLIAESLSPRELAQCVESGNYEMLSELTGIPKDRSARTILALKDGDLGEILVASIEDNVRMLLLDGLEYKDIGHLSSGQRCTVTLSVILQHQDRILIIDQPEDHIDNAFISETLIKSLRSRGRDGQIIVTTHNANIPVLGNADFVVQLVSDGRNAAVEVGEKIDHPQSVNAITTVMEGGMAAFKNRAKFYSTHKRS